MTRTYRQRSLVSPRDAYTRQMKPPLNVWLILHAAAHASMASKEQLFLLVTEPRSGSDWLVDLLDAHPNVCVPAGRYAVLAAVRVPRRRLARRVLRRAASRLRDLLGRARRRRRGAL